MNQPEPTTDTTRTRRLAASTGRRAERGGRQSRTGVLPPVLLSVWLAAPLTGCCPTCEQPTSAACAQRLPQGLARQITDAYSRAGEVVFVPDASNGTLLIPAARTPHEPVCPSALGRQIDNSATSSARGEPLAPEPVHRLTYPRCGRVHGRPTQPVTRIAPEPGAGVNGRRPPWRCQESASGQRKGCV
jgi:hypothetical protein